MWAVVPFCILTIAYLEVMRKRILHVRFFLSKQIYIPLKCMYLKNQQPGMVHNAGNNQRCSRVEYTDFGGPFYGVCFSGGCCQCAAARHVPNTLYTIHIIRNINKKMEIITRNPPVLPKSAMAMVGTTDKVAAQGTAHDIAIASTRCPQLSTTRVPVVPAIVQPSPMKNGIMVLPCKPTLDMVLSKRKEMRAR